MTDLNMNIGSLSDSVRSFLPRLSKYTIVFFLLLLIAVYGFVCMRIINLHNVQPDESSVATQVQASSTPHVNPAVVNQMQALQDNSVSVQALFDQARNSPFKE
jgi:hypothetical protein